MSTAEDFEPAIASVSRKLTDEHRQALRASGISDEVIAERAYWSANAHEHSEFLRELDLGSFVSRLPGLFIPLCGPSGTSTSAQLRLDLVAAGGQRYVSPAKTERAVVLDIPPRCAPALSDASVPLWITEGTKKADAGATKGLCVVALMGVTMWGKKDTHGRTYPLPDWKSIALRKRDVYVAFDSDVMTKPDVAKALTRLKRFLQSEGARVHTVVLSEAEDGGKVGLDDFFANGGTIDQLLALESQGLDHLSNAELLARLNSELAVLQRPAGLVLYDSGDGYQLCRPNDLRVTHGNYPGRDEQDAISWWLGHPGRRQYREIVFKPGRSDFPDVYNLWKGFALEPQQGDTKLLWDFTREVICANDAVRYDYLRKWMAHAVQKPGELPETAILMHSEEGTGKNVFMDCFRPIFHPRQFFMVTSIENATGHFNAHLSEAILVFANEAIWGGDKRQQGRLKSMITDRTCDVTAKGKDTIQLDNYKRMIFASNADHPVPIDRTDRRFVVYEVSNVRKGQADYFKALVAWRDDEHFSGSAALLYDLLHEDISKFNPSADRPRGGLGVYKTQSASSFEKWLESSLVNAEVRKQFKGHDCYLPWAGDVPKNATYDSYRDEARGQRDQLSDVLFWRKMREIGVISPPRKNAKVSTDDGKRTRVVSLAPLDAARASFAAYMHEDGATMWEHAVEMPPPCEECERLRDEAKKGETNDF